MPSARRSNRKRNIIIAAAVAVAVLLIGAVSAYAYVSSITGSLHEGVDQDLRAALVETDMSKEPFYMLLLGTDRDEERKASDEGDFYRSDTMILARVDAPQGTITLISIPRDTLVDLGEYGWQKINVAYGFGGASLAVEAVSKLTGVDISHYAEVDMDGLAAVVDAIGGVEVEVPVEINDDDAGGYVPAGWQTLDGEHALIVCRSRNTYVETAAAPDLMRAANQRLVLSAIAHKVLGSDIATIANTVRSAAGYVTTDLELNDIIGLAQAMQGMDTDDSFYTASLPTRALYIANGYGYPDVTGYAATDTVDPTILEGWYCVMEEDEWATMKGRMAEGQPPAEGLEIDEATGTVLATAGADAVDISTKNAWITIMNGTDREGLATRAMGMLNAEGFENITIEDAPGGYDYPETLVIYEETGRAHEASQIVDILGQGRAMQNDGNWIVENNFLIIIGEDWKGATSTSSSSAASASSSSSSA
ncbi:MAG: LCP family protein [Eggerthellaceae bacterium]|nr:LCP family protein [Eggerthellaceae bacterium]